MLIAGGNLLDGRDGDVVLMAVSVFLSQLRPAVQRMERSAGAVL
jgi:hypothetical protein